MKFDDMIEQWKEECSKPVTEVFYECMSRSEFASELLSKINHSKYGFESCDFGLFDKLIYALDNGKFFVFTPECYYGEVCEWVELYDVHCNEKACLKYKEDFDDYYKDTTNFSSFEELQEFMKGREKENGIFYKECKLCDFIIDKED